MPPIIPSLWCCHTIVASPAGPPHLVMRPLDGCCLNFPRCVLSFVHMATWLGMLASPPGGNGAGGSSSLPCCLACQRSKNNGHCCRCLSASTHPSPRATSCFYDCSHVSAYMCAMCVLSGLMFQGGFATVGRGVHARSFLMHVLTALSSQPVFLSDFGRSAPYI